MSLYMRIYERRIGLSFCRNLIARKENETKQFRLHCGGKVILFVRVILTI